MLPQLIEEDIVQIDAALTALIDKCEATTVILIDKGGFVITKKGQDDQFDTTTLGALAAASFTATQAMANMLSENNFSSTYQQGENFSMLVNNVDENCLLLVVFQAHISVGMVKFYTTGIVPRIATAMSNSRNRAPDAGVDFSMLNLADTADFFKRKLE
jgi:predicted regulator of Ras-like GTPase activity (Roadblock/LC7/MglB family)